MSTNRVVAKETEWLYKAAREGDTKQVQELLEQGIADVNYHHVNNYGSTPLIVAIVGGHVDTVEALLQGGANVAALKTPDANSPMHEACFQMNAAIVHLLLKFQEQFVDEFHDHDPKTPKWSMVNAVNQFGNVPLHAAAMAGCSEAVKALIEAGAVVDAVNCQKSTPLHHACYCTNENSQVVEMLINAGANVNAIDKNGATPLIVAAKKNQAAAISLLLQAGADPCIREESGRTAYASAVFRNHTKCVQLLEGLASEEPTESPRERRRSSLSQSMYQDYMYHHEE
ncbi:hypothetical protein THRCLA_05017 [Thraustotheca clavata]|uniref:Uncharacterized protein n=1 Tax=Thraustotheca clavata TaxID=74557 RepID=A0A1V9ZXA1_9STRA|nr:hypothetical protein THRCLA_05017 [Thraustotheca clavata]